MHDFVLTRPLIISIKLAKQKVQTTMHGALLNSQRDITLYMDLAVDCLQYITFICTNGNAALDRAALTRPAFPFEGI